MKKIFILSALFQLTASLDAADFSLSSPVLNAEGEIPSRYVNCGAGGKNVSPSLTWKNAPDNTKSFVVSVIDIHPVARHWVHWIVLNIPAGTDSLAEGASAHGLPEGAVELLNSFGTKGYGGPQPPRGTGRHEYVITVYALKVSGLDVKKKFLSDAELQEALSGKVIATASFSAYCGR